MKKQIIHARMRRSYSPGFFPFILQPGEMLPIDISKSILSKNDEFNLMRRDIFGVASFAVPKHLCTCVFKVVETKFSIGHLVCKIGTHTPFRIYGIKWDRVGFWLMDGWGMSQGISSGEWESDVRLATEDEISENQPYIGYYDELMRRKNGFIEGLTMDSKVNEHDDELV
jgi:hypothetical protein